MIRKFDDLGRISIPKEMRDKLGLANGGEAKIELAGRKIVVSNPDELDLEKYLHEKLEALDDIEQNDYISGCKAMILEVLAKL